MGDGNTSSGSAFHDNIFDNISVGGAITGASFMGTSSPTYPVNYYNNTISNISSSGAASAVYGAYLSSSSTGGNSGLNFYKNKIYNISAAGPTGVAYGVYTVSNFPYTIYNNIVGEIKAPNSSQTAPAPSAVGMNIAAGTNVSVYDNTVYLSAGTTSTGINWGSAGIYSATTTTILTLRNNIIINNSTPKGTGRAVAFQRNGTTITTYNTASNNNILYAGTPGASNVIFYDGTNSDQNIFAFKTRVNPADALSGTENVSFVSTTGADPNYLHVNTGSATIAESGGSPIAGITDDFDGDTRNASTPDIWR